MANFHPRSHRNAADQLQQSLEQLQESLVMPFGEGDPKESRLNLPSDHRDNVAPLGNWEDALEEAAADIDNFFKAGQRD